MNIKNRTLFISDNLPIMRGIDSDSIDLIYLDPPFNTKKNYKAPIGSPAEGASFRDVWTDADIETQWHGQVAEQNDHLYQMIQASEHVYDKSMKIYLTCMTIRLFEMKRILKDTGSIYLHCDPTASHYLKLVMDSVFGKNNFRNEIVWNYNKWTNASKYFQRNHDVILMYSATGTYIFNKQYGEKTQRQEKLIHAGYNTGSSGGGKKIVRIYDKNNPNVIAKMPIWIKEGRTIYEVSVKNKSLNDVWQISSLNSQAKERTGYPTQKPLALLDRIIRASSNENDVVLDPFCGCATACVAAERLNRQWIGIDISPSAEDITKLRLQDETDKAANLFNPLSDVFVRTQPPIRTDTDDPTQLRLPRAHVWKHELYGEQEGKCNGCLLLFPFRNMTIDHIVPRIQHGTDHRDNLQLLCNACNSAKGPLSQDQFIDKLKSQGIRHS